MAVTSYHVARQLFRGILGVAVLVCLMAAVLPEERVDVAYHLYDGGGVEVSGPAVLVRKNFDEKVSLAASYSVDIISSASIDVLTTASPYSERRTEYNLTADVLNDDGIVSFGITLSDESDYESESFHIDYSYEFFSGLTTASVGYSFGEDTVLQRGTDFSEDIVRNQYRLGLTQVVSKNILASINYEAIIDDGFLNSPYRAARVLGAAVPERYPGTRTSNAIFIQALNYFPQWNSALRVGYRFFWDTWGIRANTLQFQYSLPYKQRWTFDSRLRFYSQSNASFYNDNFDQEFEFLARDKELSTFTSIALGFDAEYQLDSWRYFITPKLQFSLEYIDFQYDDFFVYEDFGDINTRSPYSFDAYVFELNFSSQF